VDWLLLQHEPFESPGLFAPALTSQGVQLHQVLTYAGDRVPHPAELGSIDGILAMGGAMSALDDLRFPHLATERELLATAARSGLPVLGICLGAQLLAASLGAAVTPMPVPELGVGEITFTAQGRADPGFAGADDPLPVVHWHGDTFDLPAGAVLLASSARCRHQAFRWGERAYGLQFHAEMTSDDLAGAGDRLPAELADHQRLLPPGAAARRRFVDRFIASLVGQG
jgi:GMP synthase-like glutamine amidotransferase